MKNLSIVIPAKNEAAALEKLLPDLIRLYPQSEIIVVNDGSVDETSDICTLNKVKEVKKPYSMGNGSAIKSGAKIASREYIVFMDGDGQHRPEDISLLVERGREGFDMVVGARRQSSQASWGRFIANSIYNQLSSWIVGRKILDLTSGFRLVKRKHFLEFLYLLPNGFSYPTTSTMAFFRAGYSVSYEFIDVKERVGKSHINLVKDGIRFLLIIFKVGTLYSPLKIFLPISLATFFVGLGYYLHTYFSVGRFTNMSALLFTTSLIIFMMGLVSEQITSLQYKKDDGQPKN